MRKLYIGTSGWAYKEWGKQFFPKRLPQKAHLAYLASHFNSVEINATFYRLQSPSSFEKWRRSTPRGFRFAVKVSRYITHIKRMKAVRREWKRFLRNARPLREKQGPFLFQFPENFHGGKKEVERIRAFLKVASVEGKQKFAFEFRHESCFSEGMIRVLKKYKAALVLANSSEYPTAPLLATANFVYFRLHGPKRLFSSSYSKSDLKNWAKLMKRFLKEGKKVYVYFNNDFHAHAPANAELLESMLKGSR